ncbi:MAG: pilin [Candidatus Saccharibacteria bacterium]|nr:pilin [Candidatus Saccharibacteria bacterium]
MKKKIFGLLTCLMFVVFGLFVLSQPVWADCGGASTAIIDCGAGDNGVMAVLNTVVTIMMVLVGVLAAIGITVVGIQYMTAGDNEEKARKSKRRMFEIVIGLAAFVLMYALFQWLGVDTTGTGGSGSGGGGAGGGGAGDTSVVTGGDESGGSDADADTEEDTAREEGSEVAESAHGVAGPGSEGWVQE